MAKFKNWIQRIQREVGTWWCFDHEYVLPLLGLTWDEEFGTFPAIISPVRTWLLIGPILTRLSGVQMGMLKNIWSIVKIQSRSAGEFVW